MRASARLVEEISAELETKAAAAKQLHEDTKMAEALAAIHKDAVEAIYRKLDAGFIRSERHIRRDSILVAIGFFIAGSMVTLLVTLLVHPLP